MWEIGVELDMIIVLFMKFEMNTTMSPNARRWNSNEDIVMYFHTVKAMILNKYLPSVEYVMELRNILSNKIESHCDQTPHCDYKVFSK